MVTNGVDVMKGEKSLLELKNPRLFKILEDRESEFYGVIINLGRKIEPILNEIPRVFGNYTLHDINHSIRIMEYMYDLISDVEHLSDLDISILISSALLHDIGMRVSKDDCELI